MDGPLQVFQIILIFGFGVCCFALGYGVRELISLRRRGKAIDLAAPDGIPSSVGLSLREEVEQELQRAGSDDLNQSREDRKTSVS